MKGTIPLDAIDAAALADYAGIVGHLLAKGHARTSGASMIAGYAGASDKLDRALARFARAYADQTEADHARLVKAVGPAGCRWPTARWTGAAQPSDRADRRRATTSANPMKAAPTTRVTPPLVGVHVSPVGADPGCGG